MIKFAHIINPVRVEPRSDLHAAQPVTFQTMLRARAFAKDEVDVQLLSAQYPEDIDACPGDFQKTKDLDRSVLDLGKFKHPRKLPLIKDILDRLYDTTDADYLIYTNVDIALMPFFYLSVRDFVLHGHDSFVINRRTITDANTLPDQIPRMWSHIGEPHPGLDCFVFPRCAYRDFFLGNGCIGANHIGKILNTNLICNSERYDHFKDLHLTFHIGDERHWKSSKYEDYDDHNRKQFIHVLKHFHAKGKIEGHPAVGGYWSRFVDKERKRGLKKFISWKK